MAGIPKREPVTADDVHAWARTAGIGIGFKDRLTPAAKAALGLDRK